MISKLKSLIKPFIPFVATRPNRTSWFFLLETRKKKFSEIYHKNIWGDTFSVSGPGSNLEQTASVRKFLPIIVKEYGFNSILDIPCGDFYWMNLVDLAMDYIGGDIVAEIVEKNQKQYGSARRKFIQTDIISDRLPRVDLLFCRDCLVHFSNQDVFKTLRNVKAAGIKFLCMTTFVSRRENNDIFTGSWRPINLQVQPFNFPPPLKLISEDCPLENYRDKCLGLWKTEDLPSFK